MTEQLLNIIDRLLRIVECEQFKEAFKEEPIDEVGDFGDNNEEEEEEEREEVTETVVTPESKSEEVVHLENIIDHLCTAFGLEKVSVDGRIDVLYNPKIIEEIKKARKKLKL